METVTYRILNHEQTQFEFDFGLEASALTESFDLGVSYGPNAGLLLCRDCRSGHSMLGTDAEIDFTARF